MSVVICLKVSHLFGSSPGTWMRPKATYDLKKAEENKNSHGTVARIVPVKLADGVRV
jgi:plasmid maintenance system antidote protein VapI